MMWNWGDYGWHMPFYGVVFAPAMMAAFVIGIALMVTYLGARPANKGKSPLDVLKTRFARGEIDEAEYEDRKRHLSNS